MAHIFPITHSAEELGRTAEYSARKLAKLLRISTRCLQLQFRLSYGQTPQAWLNRKRLLDAKALLVTGLSVKQVAASLSFKQCSHFCRQFKEAFGITPLEFARQSYADASAAGGFVPIAPPAHRGNGDTFAVR
ncbi:MAG TPA: helix-turn-helix domain-containing protein [Verrucomicrobiae bacterium]|nr:helix-turn-helix domain-containing protein [Verrucomicrobiae bacterium]